MLARIIRFLRFSVRSLFASLRANKTFLCTEKSLYPAFFLSSNFFFSLFAISLDWRNGTAAEPSSHTPRRHQHASKTNFAHSLFSCVALRPSPLLRRKLNQFKCSIFLIMAVITDYVHSSIHDSQHLSVLCVDITSIFRCVIMSIWMPVDCLHSKRMFTKTLAVRRSLIVLARAASCCPEVCR